MMRVGSDVFWSEKTLSLFGIKATYPGTRFNFANALGGDFTHLLSHHLCVALFFFSSKSATLSISLRRAENGTSRQLRWPCCAAPGFRRQPR